MNIFVTGASGFIGSRFIALSDVLFDKSDNIIALTSKRIDGVKCIIHDDDFHYSTEDFLKIEGEIDVLLLIGHYIADRHNGSDIAIGNINSINSTIKLLETLPDKPKRIVFCSTMDVYGNDRSGVIDEKSPVSPQTPYSLSKLLIEDYLNEWCRTHGGGTDLRVLRLCHIYGMNDSRNYTVTKWLQAEMDNEPIRIFANPNQYKNSLFIDDCCEILAKACKLQNIDPVINVIAKKTHTLKSIAEVCAEVTKNRKGLIIEPSIDEKKGLNFGEFEKTLCRKNFGDKQIELTEGLHREYLYYVGLRKTNG